MTLNGVTALFCIISLNSVAFKAHYIKMMVDDTPILSGAEM